MEGKKLYLSADRKLGGVCGGIAEFFGIDATLVRLAYALLTLFSATFPGLLLYIIMWAIVPQKKEYE